MAKLESVLYFLEETFQNASFPDYPNALNGLQVEGGAEVATIGAAVDASEITLMEAARRGHNLLLVHHGLFWGGLTPVTGPLFRKLDTLLQARMGLYSCHLPLDAHAELGNNALLMKKLGLEAQGRFGSFEGVEIGWWAAAGIHRDSVLKELENAVEGEARLIPGGPEEVGRVGVVTGGGASLLQEAVSRGLDTLVTGEAPHHAYHEAMELGVNLFLGGHYATETFGVKAVAARLAKEFGVAWEFLDFPTGL